MQRSNERESNQEKDEKKHTRQKKKKEACGHGSVNKGREKDVCMCQYGRPRNRAA